MRGDCLGHPRPGSLGLPHQGLLGTSRRKDFGGLPRRRPPARREQLHLKPRQQPTGGLRRPVLPTALLGVLGRLLPRGSGPSLGAHKDKRPTREVKRRPHALVGLHGLVNQAHQPRIDELDRIREREVSQGRLAARGARDRTRASQVAPLGEKHGNGTPESRRARCQANRKANETVLTTRDDGEVREARRDSKDWGRTSRVGNQVVRDPQAQGLEVLEATRLKGEHGPTHAELLVDERRTQRLLDDPADGPVP